MEVVERPKRGTEGAGLHHAGAAMSTPEVDDWFVREVLPLEPILMHFLQHNWRNKSEIDDLCQDVYVRVYEAAQGQLPEHVKPFVLTTARNLLIDKVRQERIVPIDAVDDLDAIGSIEEMPGAERIVLAREELRIVQAALDKLPSRCRQAVVFRKIDGLSRREIAIRM